MKEQNRSGRKASESRGPRLRGICAHAHFGEYDVTMKRVCVECGKESADQELYREFSGGTIQLSQCVSRQHNKFMATS